VLCLFPPLSRQKLCTSVIVAVGALRRLLRCGVAVHCQVNLVGFAWVKGGYVWCRAGVFVAGVLSVRGNGIN
jgi:hypothetical protein